jgi:hypothetical protein
MPVLSILLPGFDACYPGLGVDDGFQGQQFIPVSSLELETDVSFFSSARINELRDPRGAEFGFGTAGVSPSR